MPAEALFRFLLLIHVVTSYQNPSDEAATYGKSTSNINPAAHPVRNDDIDSGFKTITHNIQDIIALDKTFSEYTFISKIAQQRKRCHLIIKLCINYYPYDIRKYDLPTYNISVSEDRIILNYNETDLSKPLVITLQMLADNAILQDIEVAQVLNSVVTPDTITTISIAVSENILQMEAIMHQLLLTSLMAVAAYTDQNRVTLFVIEGQKEQAAYMEIFIKHLESITPQLKAVTGRVVTINNVVVVPSKELIYSLEDRVAWTLNDVHINELFIPNETRNTAINLYKKLSTTFTSIMEYVMNFLVKTSVNEEDDASSWKDFVKNVEPTNLSNLETTDVVYYLYNVLEQMDFTERIPMALALLQCHIRPMILVNAISKFPVYPGPNLYRKISELEQFVQQHSKEHTAVKVNRTRNTFSMKGRFNNAIGASSSVQENDGSAKNENITCQVDSWNPIYGHLQIAAENIEITSDIFLRKNNPLCPNLTVESVAIFAAVSVTLVENITVTMSWDNETNAPEGIQEIVIISPVYNSSNFTIHLTAEPWGDNWCYGLNKPNECKPNMAAFETYNITKETSERIGIIQGGEGVGYRYPWAVHDGLPSARLLFIVASVVHDTETPLLVTEGGKPGGCLNYPGPDFSELYKEALVKLNQLDLMYLPQVINPCDATKHPALPRYPVVFLLPDSSDVTMSSGFPGIFSYYGPRYSESVTSISNKIIIGLSDPCPVTNCTLFNNASFDDNYCEKPWEGTLNFQTGYSNSTRPKKPYLTFKNDTNLPEAVNITEWLEKFDLSRCKTKDEGSDETRETWYCLTGKQAKEGSLELQYKYTDFGNLHVKPYVRTNPILDVYSKYYRYTNRFHNYLEVMEGICVDECVTNLTAFNIYTEDNDDFIQAFLTPSYLNCLNINCNETVLDINKLISDIGNMTTEPNITSRLDIKHQLSKISVMIEILNAVPTHLPQTQFQLNCLGDGNCTTAVEKCTDPNKVNTGLRCLPHLNLTITPKETKLILLLNSVLLGQQHHLQKTMEGVVAVHMDSVLTAAEIVLVEYIEVQKKDEELKNATKAAENMKKRAEKMKQLNEDFGKDINKKVDDGMKAIKESLSPVVEEILRLLTGLLGKAVQSIMQKKAETEEEIKQKQEEIKKAKEELQRKKVFGWLGFFTSIVSAVSPGLGMVMQAGVAIAETVTGPGSVPEKLKKSFGYAKDSSDVIGKLMKNKKLSYGPFEKIVKKAEGAYGKVKDKYEHVVKKYDNLKSAYEMEMGQELPSFKKLDQLRDNINSGFNELQNLIGSRSDVALDVKEAAKELASCSKLGGLVAAGFDAASDGGEDKNIKMLEEAIADLKQRLVELNQMEYEVMDTFLPMLRSISSFVRQFSGGEVRNDSLAVIATNEYKVKDGLIVLKHKLGVFLKKLGDEDLIKELEFLITRLDLAMSTIFKIYEQIEKYKDQKKMADYMYALLAPDMENIQLPPLPPKEEMEIAELKNRTGKYVAIFHYERALRCLEFFAFPMAFEFQDLNSLNIVGENQSIIETLESAVSHLKLIQSRLLLEKSIIIEGDSYRARQQFYAGLKTSYPFYMWESSNFKKLIQQLLTGEEITVVALVTKSAMGIDAIKFTEVDLEFLFPGGQLDEFTEKLKEVRVKMTHSGSNYYRFGKKNYLLASPEFSMEFSFEFRNGERVYEDSNYRLLKSGDATLSPYTQWNIKLYTPPGQQFPDFGPFLNMSIDLCLSGVGTIIKTYADDFNFDKFDVDSFYPEAPPFTNVPQQESLKLYGGFGRTYGKSSSFMRLKQG